MPRTAAINETKYTLWKKIVGNSYIWAGGAPAPSFFSYLRPDGIFTYLRPDGTSRYERP